ncbi:MAG: ABC transporter substrate-binding protein [Solimonas sp.]
MFSVHLRRAAGMLAALSLALAALPAGAGDAVKTIRIAAPAIAALGKPSYAGTSAAVIEKGFVDEELARVGVKAEWVPANTSSVAAFVNEAFAQKRIEFAMYGDLPSIIANGSGIRTRLLVPGGGLSNTYLVVPAHSPARSIEDLKGKRIAVHRGRPWEFPFDKLLKSKGLSFSDFTILNLNPQAGAAAVSTGSADAFVTLSDAWVLVDKKVGRIIWNSGTQSEDWQMRAEVWGDEAFVQQHPQIAQALVTGIVRTYQWASQEQSRPEFVNYATRFGQSASVIEREIDSQKLEWKQRWSPLFTPAVRQHYVEEIAYARDAKLIRQDVDVDALFDKRFVTTALAQLQLDRYWAAQTAPTQSAQR